MSFLGEILPLLLVEPEERGRKGVEEERKRQRTDAFFSFSLSRQLPGFCPS